MEDEEIVIYEDLEWGERVYFAADGDLICDSWTHSECGESSNVLDEEAQRKLYEVLKAKFESK